ncbi:hypothetical protein LCGC14_0387830 [marine sediment metagenome]|uniref:Uncharacterized protein n=1 Tax=marine sediment metagenome TaxID=412755 RepID=A0A0F9VMM5_9ZZZZ
MKIVKDDWEFKVERVNGEMLYSAHYEVKSEGVSQRRGTPIEFTPQEETQISNFIMNVVRPKVEEAESGN